MKDKVKLCLTVVVCLGLLVCGFVFGYNPTQNQLKTLNILIIICLASIAYVFIVGEISRNNSQMDKLWSILPIVYSWIIFGFSGCNIRVLVAAILVTLWGIRLTYNFGKKGAYKLKFWQGEEDYRWAILRSTKPFDNKIVWAIFDFGFISLWQNIVILGISLPLLAIMDSKVPFSVFDGLVAALALIFLIIEIIADRQQNAFQIKKYEYLHQGKKLEELPMPYKRGFNITGLWAYIRHPNYLGEQGFWLSIYLFTICGGVCVYGIFNWTLFGSMLLLLIFAGSSRMAEGISCKKYIEYSIYQKQVFKYLPLKKYNSNSK